MMIFRRPKRRASTEKAPGPNSVTATNTVTERIIENLSPNRFGAATRSRRILERRARSVGGYDPIWSRRSGRCNVPPTGIKRLRCMASWSRISGYRPKFANWRKLTSIEGRVLVHDEEEHSGKSYLMLEATVGRIFYIPYTTEMEDIRSRGGLKTNSFIRLRKQFDRGRLTIETQDYGSAKAVLTKPPPASRESAGSAPARN